MGSLRIKAQEILNLRQNKIELDEITDYVDKENDMNIEKEKSKKIFTEKIQKEIDDFDKNLLESANCGEPLNIKILRLDTDGLLSWWDERE
ncbi:MAG: hypothetical protein KAU90_03535, partial [Sulfurovaceae bacterium]|nr:hypothetical protein [Sulfurovaceae bacterium]